MKNVIYENCPHTCGIYKIDFPNGKIYIGQAKDIKERMRHHNNPNNLETLVDQKIKQYLGKVKNFTLLEYNLDPNNQTELDKKEIYYIQYYKSTIKENGYNISPGGNSGNPLVCQPKFSKEETLEIIKLIQNNPTIRFTEIAKQYDCHINTIQKINQGYSPYHFENISYPIRTADESRVLKNILSEDTIVNILYELRYTNNTMQDIGAKYNLHRNTISNINNGKKQPILNYDYPARITRRNKDGGVR